jgi:hypothetical protein
MKRIAYLLILLLCTNCQEVVEIATPSEPPRLVIEGLIRVDRDEPFIPVIVKISETNNFFGDIPITSVESILIVYTTMEDGIATETGFSNLAEEVPGSGIYTPDPNFMDEQRIRTSILDKDIVFDLIINHEGRKYFASTKYVPVVPIDRLTQGSETLFSGDETEVLVSFTDNGERSDFYLFDFSFGNYLVTEDKFYQGQPFEFSYFYETQLQAGTELTISLLGADEQFYNYMNQLIVQGGQQQGPFQTPVSTVRGNIYDVTDLDNIDLYDNVDQPNVFPLGYFAIVEAYSSSIIIQ